jgi:DNA-binding LytR/AlgR family response regulator
MKITTIILDDNLEHLSYLEKLLLEIEEISLVQKFTNSIKAQEWLSKNKVDLLITDIEIKNLNGLELMEQLEKPPQVIFASTYPEYAADSFKLDPLHYLAKPINEIDLRIAIERAKNKLLKKEVEEHIIIKEGHALFHKINLSDIFFVEADDDYVIVSCKAKKYRTHSSLKVIHKRLTENFIRTHRSYIVNKQHITTYTNIDLKVGSFIIPISRAYKDKVALHLNA